MRRRPVLLLLLFLVLTATTTLDVRDVAEQLRELAKKHCTAPVVEMVGQGSTVTITVTCREGT